jgi:hypothetical protein
MTFSRGKKSKSIAQNNGCLGDTIALITPTVQAPTHFTFD